MSVAPPGIICFVPVREFGQERTRIFSKRMEGYSVDSDDRKLHKSISDLFYSPSSGHRDIPSYIAEEKVLQTEHRVRISRW